MCCQRSWFKGKFQPARIPIKIANNGKYVYAEGYGSIKIPLVAKTGKRADRLARARPKKRAKKAGEPIGGALKRPYVQKRLLAPAACELLRRARAGGGASPPPQVRPPRVGSGGGAQGR